MNCSVSRSSKYDKRSAPVSSVTSTSEWSEHISSSGKKYYYNSISEVSQWEKPREWDSRRTTSKDSTYSTRNSKYCIKSCLLHILGYTKYLPVKIDVPVTDFTQYKCGLRTYMDYFPILYIDFPILLTVSIYPTYLLYICWSLKKDISSKIL